MSDCEQMFEIKKKLFLYIVTNILDFLVTKRQVSLIHKVLL